MLSDHPRQLTIFVSATKDVSHGVAVAWRQQRGWKTKASSLGKYITIPDAAVFAIGMVVKDIIQVLRRADRCFAEIVTDSQLAIAAIENDKDWTLPVITDIRRWALRAKDADVRVALTWLASDKNIEGYRIASLAAQRAAQQQPKRMRSASLSHVKQTIKERWKPQGRIDIGIKDAKKSVAARYLQLKSGHAVTGIYLFRIGKALDAHCWWCGAIEQSVTHLLLRCRRWRRQRDYMLRRLSSKKVSISERRDKTDLQTLFRAEAVAEVLQFLEDTEVGKKMPGEGAQDDSWDIERLDRTVGESEMAEEVGEG
jgi:hypothetical protein